MQQLLERVKSGNFTLSILGIGRVGLPLGLSFANAGVPVIGVDKNEELVKSVSEGRKPFHEDGIESYLQNKNFTATTNSREAVEKSDAIIITVGTPLTEHMRPDYSYLYNSINLLGECDIRGKIMIIRSTSSPNTLEGYVKPYLEKKTGLAAGKDFGLAVCPERILEGKAFEELKVLPELVGGIDETSSRITMEIFKKLNPEKKFIITTPKSAEMAKLFTNVYRYVNFALANEFALIAEEYGEDAHEIIKSLNEGYKRGGLPSPGLTGGPCLSKDGYYLTSNIVFPDFILMAWRLNEAIPRHVVNKVKKRFAEKEKPIHNSKIAVLGVSFKKNIDDTRYSPAMKIVETLKEESIDVAVHDPLVKWTQPLEEAVKGADAIIIATNHSAFEGVHRKIQSAKPGCILMDCWGMIDPREAREAGFDYLRFGDGSGTKKL